MTPQEAIKVLREYQNWRLGAETEQLNPKIVTEALSVLIDEVEKLDKHNGNDVSPLVDVSGAVKLV